MNDKVIEVMENAACENRTVRGRANVLRQIAALNAAGYCIRPIKSTREMRMAAETLISSKGANAIFTLVDDIYTAMIQAWENSDG